MTRHVVTSTRFDLPFFEKRKAEDAGPVHVVGLLADRLDATVHQPGDVEPNAFDRAAARLVGTPEHWAIARMLAKSVDDGDLIYATGSDAGLPIALANLRTRRARVAVYFVAPSRPRPAGLSKLLARLPGSLMAVTGTAEKVALMQASIGDRVPDIHLADEQTDVEFFAPAVSRSPRTSPLVVSCGLEQRDYVTLAAALDGLDVDTKICAASPNFTSKTTVAMPDSLPERAEMRLFEFPELRELYQQADVTVVSLLPNDYSAGLTVMLEAIACGSPVVISETKGLAQRFIADDLVIGVPPQDATALRTAIEGILSDAEAAAARAQRARTRLLSHHTSSIYVDELVEALETYERR